MIRLIKKIIAIIKKMFCRRERELVEKVEQPKTPVKNPVEKPVENKVEEAEETPVERPVEDSVEKAVENNEEDRLILEEVDSRFSGSMNISKDILSARYLKNGRSVKEVAAIFNVSESTIRRRQKILNDRATEVYRDFCERTGHTGQETLDIMKEFYGPTFETDENGHITVIV